MTDMVLVFLESIFEKRETNVDPQYMGANEVKFLAVCWNYTDG